MPERQPDFDPALTSAAVYANSFRTVKPTVRSVGFRTHELRHEAARHLPDRNVAEEFLVNSRLRRRDVEFDASIAEYFSESGTVALSLLGQEGQRGERLIPLPKAIPLKLSLEEAVRQRRSVRAYTGDPVPLAYLAMLARMASGVTGQTGTGPGGPRLVLRATPSGGGLYPIDLQFAALRVDGLPRGCYLYDPRLDQLWQTGDEAALNELLGAVATPEEIISISRAGAICLLVGRPWRGMRKYGERGMRHLFIEAGAIAEQINLTAVALGLGSVDCSSFYDDEVHEALQIDGVYEALIHALVIGVPG
jgi:SagB-type dehydrogenase family enzyme